MSGTENGGRSHCLEELARARDGGRISPDERTSLALDTAKRYVAGLRPDW